MELSPLGNGLPVRRGSPDPAVRPTGGLLEFRKTCGHAEWLGPTLFAAVPETGHNGMPATSTQRRREEAVGTFAGVVRILHDRHRAGRRIREIGRDMIGPTAFAAPSSPAVLAAMPPAPLIVAVVVA